MKNYKFLLTVLALLLLSASVAFVSCTDTGDETTVGEPQSSEMTESPETDVTETTDSETTEVEETTESEETTEAPHDHVWSELVIVKEPTCTEYGKSEQSCSCGEKRTFDENLLPHTEGEWIIDKEATATEEGSKHQVCSVCGETLKTEVIPVTPHTPGEWIVDKAATCTEAGSKHRVCTKCGEVANTEVIPATGHTEVIDPLKTATCTEDGATEGKHCSVCNTVLIAQTVIPATGHNEKLLPAKAPTCTESGVTEGKACTVCNAQLVPQQTLTATGHKDGEWIVDKEATLTETGLRHLACTVCGQTIKTETIPVIEPVKLDFTVTVLDGTGNPASGVKVVFTSSGNIVAELTTDESGKAVANLPEGEYQVVSEPAEGFYAPNAVDLTPSAASAKIMIVPYAQNPELTYPDEVNGVYSVSVGSVRVPVKKDEMRYFFFAPTEGAYYRVYTDSDKVGVGYYGGSFYVSETNSGTMLDDGVMELKFLKSSVGNVLVIGLKSTSSAVDECTLTIVKYSDIEVQDVERPWDQYELGKTPTKLETPSGELKNVPITVTLPAGGAVSEIPVYYNANDGYYHLNSETGPILYVRINTASIYQEALATIAGVTNIGCYFYDDQGNFLKKESYNDALLLYAEVADATHGVVPLDDDLIYILKNISDNGWYDRTSPDCIFTDDGVIVMPFNGWLFACVYFE